MNKKVVSLRGWSTPLTIGAFLLLAITGVLMFFEWDVGLVTVVHQWFSWAFLIGAVGHVVANIRPFRNHLASPVGKASVTAFSLVVAASLFSWGLITGPQLERPIEEALVDAPLSALANTIRVAPDDLLLRLEGQGVFATAGQSIRQLAASSGVDENRLLALIFLRF
ncbi:DUF4405 domain-containing protein [Rhizobium halophytocola]|uniref:DUF4405 domain-containing protein n=1 Tax=Rhizobium halophytocola TaxID=735519 RepID=A0ABS4DSF3_9HYPH|nr:DUF4405 domain-containing protein [Rhizobium halophytocola]MBP1848618.1 hypothetical protein [Rhizobium halophytocola]